MKKGKERRVEERRENQENGENIKICEMQTYAKRKAIKYFLSS